MDGEEGISHDTEIPSHKYNSSKDNKRIEAKGSCLKIEGKEGYVFKSYRVTPQDTQEAEVCTSPSEALEKASPLVSLSLEATEEDFSSEAEGLLIEDSNEESLENHQTSPVVSHKSESTDVRCSEIEKSLHIKPEPNETSEHSQEDEKLIFDGAFGPFATKSYEDDYGSLFSGYSSTLYDVAMDAVTQSLLTSIRSPLNPRKKSPAWKHFFISPRDSTKAICMYCMKEFSRGKNEKDLSTSCLMRHVRRAHPNVLLQDCDSLNNLSNTSSLPLPNNEDLHPIIKPSADNHTPMSSVPTEAQDAMPKDSLQKSQPKAEKSSKTDTSAASSPHSLNNHLEDTSDFGIERSGSVPKSSSSRRRSAVWKHFYLSPADSSKAVCIHCMNEFSRGKNGKDLGTSCLIRHMWRAHRDIVIDENAQGSSIPPPYTTPPTLLSTAQESPDVKAEFLCTSDHPEVISDVVPNNESENTALEDDEDASNLIGPESLDGSLRLKGESTLSFSLEEHTDRHSMSQDQSSVFQQNKKIMKRVKSEVWHHFIVSPVDQLKALCRYCPCVISRGKRGDFGTSCLMRHLMRRHPDVLQTPKSTSDISLSQSPHPDLPVEDAFTSNAVNSLSVENKPHTLPSFSKKTSKLWNHFSICSADPTKVVCLHCKRTISRGKKTTNLGTSCLFRHMQRFHGHVLENNSKISGDVAPAESKVKQEPMDISAYEENADKFSECHPAAKKITKLVAEMLALDLHPSTVVENVGLNRLLEYLQPRYSLPPSAYFTSTAIPEMYERVKEVVFTHLKEAEGGIVHFTTSVWVSSQTQEYLILTAHWVSFESQVLPQGQDFHCSALLGVASIDCDYNMLNTQKQLELLWDTWVGSSGLKIGFTVTDNQSIRSILESSDHTTMQCFGHSIDLIVNEAIKTQRMVQNLLSIARKVCERVHRSAKAKVKMAELQKAYHLPENQLVQDVPSKWKTSYFMLERLVEQKKAIDELSAECSFRELISCDQWEVMQSVCNALKPFVVACREMSSRTATLGQVIPLIHILNRKIDMLFDETMGIDNMLKSLKEALVTRMSPTLHDPRYIWATMLDPRYKTSLFTEEEAEQCKHDLIQELEGARSISVEPNAPLSNGCSEFQPTPNTFASNKENLWALMDDIRQKIKQEEKPKSMELAVLEYLEEDILDQSCDPLDYWNLKKLLWPDLAKVAVRYVGCPPSVVPADTLFSTSSVNCAPNLSRTLLENLEGLLFLKVNLPLIYFQY